MKFSILATLFLLVGCSTTGHFSEPERSQFYLACMNAGWPVTGCDCLERSALKAGAQSKIRPGDSAALQELRAAVTASVPACREETDKVLKDAIDGDAPEATPQNNHQYPRGK